jgi:hypothetical protein
MIQKLHLTSAISKYYLNAMNEAVIWEIKDNILTVKFTAPSKEMLGSVTFHNVPLEDSKIGISNTTQLNKLIHITSGVLDLKYVKQKNTPYKLIIADKSFTVNYSLADLMIIPKPGDIIGDINFNIKASIDNEDITSVVKAKSAVAESETVVIKPSANDDGEYTIEMEFGGNVEYANKVSFYLSSVETVNVPDNFKVQYNSEMIKEIMAANKDMHEGFMSINLDGIMKLEFANENKTLTSVYYLVAKEI